MRRERTLFALALTAVGCVGEVGSAPSSATTNADGGVVATITPGADAASTPVDAARPTVPVNGELDCTGVQPDGVEIVVPRLTRNEYIRTIEALFDVDIRDRAGDLPYEVRAPTSTTSSAQTIDFLHVRAYEQIAAQVADEADLSRFGSCPEFSESCVHDRIERLGSHVFRRPIDEPEIDGYRPIFAVVDSENDSIDVAMRLTLRSMLQSPQFLYHLERADTERVAGFELANRISYLVWQAPPDAELLQAAESGALETPTQIAAQLRRMVADPRAHVASMAFIDDWIDLTRLERATGAVEEDLKRQMRAETEAFVEQVLWTERRGLFDLLRSDQTFVSREVGELYGLDTSGWDDSLRSVDLQSVPERRGLLTQASVLASHANGNRPAIVSRGLFLLRSVFCRDVPDPPAAVDTGSTELPETASEREKSTERLQRAACGACHHAFDPLAYAFEPYDGTGRYASLDAHGNETRTDGWLPNIGGENVSYSDVDSMIDALERSQSVAECLVEWPLSYGIRRALDRRTISDACAIEEIRQEAESTGASYESLLTAIATHPIFARAR